MGSISTSALALTAVLTIGCDAPLRSAEKSPLDAHNLIPLLQAVELDDDPDARAQLRSLGDRALPALRELLQSRVDPAKPSLAIAGFATLKPTDPSTLEFLEERLQDRRTSYHAAIALSRIEGAGVARLVAERRNPMFVRKNIAIALAHNRADGHLAVPALLRLLGDPESEVSEQAAASLGRIHAEPARIIPGLLTRLTSTNAAVRRACLRAIGSYGTNAAYASNALTASLRDPDPTVRNAATNTLQRLGAAPD